MKKRGLGKGVSALFENEYQNEEVQKPTDYLSIHDVEPNREQPRKVFDKEKLSALADSIREHGIVQPLIVVKTDGYYTIVAGERRWRAAKMVGLKEVPVIIRDYTARETEEIALIENLQRENLNPMEEAAGYRQLMDKFGLTQEEVSKRMGKSRPAVTNALRLFSLPEDVQKMVEKSELSVGHAKVLLGLDDKKRISEIAAEIVKKGLNVRQTEAVVQQKTSKSKPVVKKDENVTNAISDACTALERKLGTKVKISYSSTYKGKVEISFKDLKQMTQIVEQIGK